MKLYQMMMVLGLFTFCPLLAGSDQDGVDRSAFLMEPFKGFSKQGLAPVIKLFQEDTQGRNILRRALSRTKLRSIDQLPEILAFCEPELYNSGWERRGLFTQETAYFYRALGEEDWQDGGTGELAKLANPTEFPVSAQKQYRTNNFEHMEVAFRPKICLKPGMSVMETYLVLYHELVHLTGIDQFGDLDLFSFRQHNKVDRFYYRQLSKKGGEVDAYLAQLQAFKRLKKKYTIPERWVLESFLNPKGHLDYRDREAFMEHLLTKVGYRIQLDQYLTVQVLNQYNRAYAWWEYLDRLIEHYDRNYKIITENLKNIGEQIKQYKNRDREIPRQLSEARKKWQRTRESNRHSRKSYRNEQLDLERFMEKVDRYHPREE